MPAFPRELRKKWNPELGYADLVLKDGDLELTNGPIETLETWITDALLTDRRADPGDVLPPGDDDPRGYFGDNLEVVPGDRRGSKLWLRREATPQMPTIVENDALEATLWTVEDGYIAGIEADAVYNEINRQEIDLTVTAILLTGQRCAFEFKRLVRGLA